MILEVNGPIVTPAHVEYERQGQFVDKNSGTFFLPQRPYMVLGTLRQQLLYPMWVDNKITIADSTKSKCM